MSIRRALFPVALVLALAACGDDGPECVIDTDCQLGYRCASDRTCRAIGAQTDAGASDAGARDAAVTDSGARDASTPDSGPACVALTPGTYAETVGGCGVAMSATLTVRAGASACEWMIATVADAAVAGTLSVDAEGAVTASLSLAGAEAVACTGTYDATASTLAITCPPDCTLTLDHM
ncbi:hypothetical protein [Sandaracinus amylolyticus]|uniref:Lipoprotein n=1 Tax=Sandaracinus amylolyticus TaxID=927083 RepID=A0A0F6YH06_9BACT|nr:hypothetical protein [Sandaracinus amylolyticus]AKF05303.1 hypothetical protein DB32_002452 [Sandaracinus amylolyticus]